ncbi:MAG: phosphoribosyltransferase family protein [Candidatus Jorgensenbacteria bacterium]|nr:phosphoribosyltransferase family protein [Candidatus Jorgensenbacteria bacterium]
MISVIQFLIDALFPPQCVACDKKLPSSARFVSLCDECLERVPIRNGFVCSVCGARQFSLINTCHGGALIIAAATDYTNREAQLLIHALKYNGSRSATYPLTEILIRYIESREELSTHSGFILIAVPLHKKRLRERGFNQSELIAKSLHEQLPDKFSYLNNVLNRTRNTPSQTEQKTHPDRNKNMSGAFEVVDPKEVVGKIIFLVDDVSTSGATIREAGRALKNAGARSVFGLVVAKA